MVHGGVVVVAVQHRLGALGFPGLESRENLGLQDLVLAVTWIQENIGRFGGVEGTLPGAQRLLLPLPRVPGAVVLQI